MKYIYLNRMSFNKSVIRGKRIFFVDYVLKTVSLRFLTALKLWPRIKIESTIRPNYVITVSYNYGKLKKPVSNIFPLKKT